MTVDANLIFLVLVFAAVFAAAQAAVGLFTVATQKRQLNRRLKVAEKVDGISALVVELRKQRGLSASGAKGERLRWHGRHLGGEPRRMPPDTGLTQFDCHATDSPPGRPFIPAPAAFRG